MSPSLSSLHCLTPLQNYTTSEASTSESGTLMPCEQPHPDDSPLSSLSPTADSMNFTRGKKRKYLNDENPPEQVQKSYRSLVRHTDKLQSHALKVATSYSKFEDEKVALKEQVRKLEKENCPLKEERVTVNEDKVALTERFGKLERENTTLQEHFAAHVKEIDALEKQNATTKARLVSPQR